MKNPYNRIASVMAGVLILTSAEFRANAQVTAQNPGNIVNSGTNAFSYLVMEGESFIDSTKLQGDGVGFVKVYNDGGATYTDFYGNPILDTNTTASMQGALGTVGPLLSQFGDKVTYQVVFSRPGDYYMYMRFTMFENGGGPTPSQTNSYGNEDSFYFPPDFNKDPETDWNPPGSPGAHDGGYCEGCCSGAGFLYILDYQGNGTRTDRFTEWDTNGVPQAKLYWEGNFHWNQLFSSQFLNPTIGTPAAPFHYVVTPAMVGVPQSFTIAYREQGVTIDLFLFSTHTNMMNDYTQQQLDDLFVNKVAVQQPENRVITPTNTYPFLKMEAENYFAKTNHDITRGFGAVTVGSTNISFYGAPMLATNTGASGKGALATVNPLSSFSDFISYRVQFQTAGDYYLYFRFTMFENGGNTNLYGNEDSFYVPPDFNKNPMTDWDPAGAPGVNDGGYCEGCCNGAGFLYILDYQGNGTRTDYYNEYDTNGVPLLARLTWEGGFRWNQCFSSQFLNPATQGQPGVPFHYVVTPAEVGVPMTWTISCREVGVTPDAWLFSTHTNLLNDYTQAQLDQQYLSPQLTVSSSGGNVIVSWPVSASTYILESTPSLSSPSWTTVDQGAALAGSRWNLTVAAAGGAKYFRLRQP